MTAPASHDPRPPARAPDRPCGTRSSSCEECFEQLDRYVELELDGADADAAVPGMRAHLEGCSACDEDHDSLHALLARRGRPPTRDGRASARAA